ncbi:ubiquitin-like domain-containing protein [Brevibacillus sp. H7]|uniref:ubiquitin-like domain-containing protein n=1 Tax=Brevibacillus sp. H7 TaxID=3349138 RepID=UPI00380B0D96
MELSKLWAARKTLVLPIAGGLALVLLSILGYFSILATQPKQVTLTLDGSTQTYETQAETIEQFLAEQKIPVTDNDQLSPAATTELIDGATIEVHTSWVIPVEVDGQTKMVHTLHRDVAGVIKDAGIALGDRDQVQPALTAALTKETKIRVTRIAEKVVQVDQRVPFQEIRKNDASLTKGQTRVLQKGQEGKAVLHYKLVTANGKEVSRELVKTDVITPKIDRIVAVGTASAVTAEKRKRAVAAASTVSRGGRVFRPHKVLSGVTLTAYTPAGGGKPKSSPGYGRTAIGVMATEGRTIAVDPSVIPMGWWVFIDGIGYRRAEDTGGAVRGNKIDVFFNNHAEAVQFGRKRNKTVYIIGPQKP